MAPSNTTQRNDLPDGVPLIPTPSQRRLNDRQRQDYETHRRNLLTWLHTKGKNPQANQGYSHSSLKNTAYRLDQFYRWVWDELGYTTNITSDQGNGYLLELNNLDIEHIAPRNTFGNSTYAEWRRKLNEEEFEDRKDKLGNLTLLLPNDHSILDETSFESKKQTYTNSDIKIAEEVAGYEEWTDDEIEERTDRLAKELVERWSI